MRVPRVFIAGARAGTTVDLSGPAFHHIVRVLRRAPGDPLVVLDGQGGVFAGRLSAVDPASERGKAEVGDALPAPGPRICRLSAALGLPRGDAFENAIRWGSEMGLAKIIPLLTSRSVVRLAPDERTEGSPKLKRWRRIAIEAAEQCRRPAPLEIACPSALPDFLRQAAGGPSRWIAMPGAADLFDSGFLENLRDAQNEVMILVGPEGGFEQKEIEQSIQAGFNPVGFPTHVLRTPTAIAYLASLASVACSAEPPR